MAGYKKDEKREQYTIQYRFTAYLKIAISHQKARYLVKLHERKNLELFYEDHLELLYEGHYVQDTYFGEEIQDEQLCHALHKLKQRDRLIVFRHAVFGESFVEIATDWGLK